MELQDAVIYNRSSNRARKRAENQRILENQRLNCERIAHALKMNVRNVVNNCESIGKKKHVSNVLLATLLDAQANRYTLLLDSISRVGRTIDACMDFAYIAAQMGVQWIAVREQLTHENTRAEVHAAAELAEIDYWNRATAAKERAARHNLITTHEDRAKGNAVIKERFTPPYALVSHLKTVYFTTDASLSEIAESFNILAEKDPNFKACAPYTKRKIQAYIDRFVRPKKS